MGSGSAGPIGAFCGIGNCEITFKEMKTPNVRKQIRILTQILRLTEKPGTVRAWVIGIIFPEFGEILGKLSELSNETENPTNYL